MCEVGLTDWGLCCLHKALSVWGGGEKGGTELSLQVLQPEDSLGQSLITDPKPVNHSCLSSPQQALEL